MVFLVIFSVLKFIIFNLYKFFIECEFYDYSEYKKVRLDNQYQLTFSIILNINTSEFVPIKLDANFSNEKVNMS